MARTNKFYNLNEATMKLNDYGRWTKINVIEPKRIIMLKGHLPPNEIRKNYPGVFRYAYIIHGIANVHPMVPITYVKPLPKSDNHEDA